MTPKNSIFIATPMYDGKCFGRYTNSLIGLQKICRDTGVGFTFGYLTDCSIISLARNLLVDMFLSTECTHLLFVDADIEFRPEDVMSLLAGDKDVTAGIYPGKKLNWENVRSILNKTPDVSDNTLNKVISGTFTVDAGELDYITPTKVDGAGTGLMLIKRRVFDIMASAYPKDKVVFDGKEVLCPFEMGVRDGQFVGEDYMFCRKWRETGGEVWVCPWTKVNHVGSFVFQGDLQLIQENI